MHSFTYYYPFKVIYGFIPLSPLDLHLLPLDMCVDLDGKKKVDFIRALHEKMSMNIE